MADNSRDCIYENKCQDCRLISNRGMVLVGVRQPVIRRADEQTTRLPGTYICHVQILIVVSGNVLSKDQGMVKYSGHNPSSDTQRLHVASSALQNLLSCSILSPSPLDSSPKTA